MEVTVHIPDDIATRLNTEGGGDLSHRALEALVAEEYRLGHLDKPDLRRLLGFETSYEIDDFLKLAAFLHADLLLMDDRKGVRAAEKRGLVVTGTLGVLDLAAEGGRVDFALAVELLRQTNFRIPEALLDVLLKKHQGN